MSLTKNKTDEPVLTGKISETVILLPSEKNSSVSPAEVHTEPGRFTLCKIKFDLQSIICKLLETK